MSEPTVVNAENCEDWLKAKAERAHYVNEGVHGLDMARSALMDAAKNFDLAEGQSGTAHLIRQLVVDGLEWIQAEAVQTERRRDRKGDDGE